MPNHTILPNGIGETLGDSIVVNDELYQIDGDVWYVNSATGTDAGGQAGQERLQPLATLGQAVTNAANNDMIVLQDGHAETYTSALTISKTGLIIAAAGQSAGRPTVKFTNNQAGAPLFNITGQGTQLRNIFFEEDLQANSDNRISVTGANFWMKGCYIEADGNSDATVLQLGIGANSARIESTTLISTASLTSDVPATGIGWGAALTDTSIVGCIISGGTVGWTTGYAISTGAVAQTRLLIENISMLLGADIEIHEDSSAIVSVGTATGGARIDIRTSGG